MERTYTKMKRTRLDVGDSFVKFEEIEEHKEREHLYTIQDRVVIVVTRSHLTEASRSFSWNGPLHPKPAACESSVKSYETWVKYDTHGYSAWMSLDTGICHYQIDGKKLGTDEKPMAFPEHIFLTTEL
ncbi:hypothetical protein D3C73_209580 [compost metagenome]|jgi:hypothetical protein